ncbi:hypothetical protein AB1K56_14665 [Microbacterium sp. BWR-S6Y]
MTRDESVVADRKREAARATQLRSDADRRDARQNLADEIHALVPEGIVVRTSTDRDSVEISQTDLLTLLRRIAATPTE